MDEYLREVFIQVIEKNKERILRICRAYSHTKEDQKDLYQEVALNIWKALPSFRKDSAIDTWIYRITLNVCMQYSFKIRRDNKRRMEIEGITISDEAADLSNETENVERRNKMYRCISQLDDAEKSLVLLFLEDISYKEISKITGISENHVAVKLKRIKKKLFNCINNI